MSEKDVKDNETEALNNAAAENAENADIEAGETDMATSIESVDFAVVYDDGGDSIATESAENAENTEGIATEDSVASDNANRVNETLALGATDDEQSLDQHETVQADSATSVSSQIDREIKHHRKKDAFFFKANPTFALDHVTVHNRKPDVTCSTTFPWRSMPARPTRCWWMPKMSNSIRRWWPPWSA